MSNVQCPIRITVMTKVLMETSPGSRVLSRSHAPFHHDGWTQTEQKNCRRSNIAAVFAVFFQKKQKKQSPARVRALLRRRCFFVKNWRICFFPCRCPRQPTTDHAPKAVRQFSVCRARSLMLLLLLLLTSSPLIIAWLWVCWLEHTQTKHKNSNKVQWVQGRVGCTCRLLHRCKNLAG